MKQIDQLGRNSMRPFAADGDRNFKPLTSTCSFMVDERHGNFQNVYGHRWQISSGRAESKRPSYLTKAASRSAHGICSTAGGHLHRLASRAAAAICHPDIR